MEPNLKCLPLRRLNILIILSIIGFILGISPIFESSQTLDSKIEIGEAKIQGETDLNLESLVIIQRNSILAITEPSNPEAQAIRKIRVVITGYSSSPWETDDTPYITAAGTWVRDGIVANNYLPFGTEVRIPELFGDKIFVVEDRMHWRKGNYHIDIWFPSRWQALNFGVKRTYIEILER